MLLLGEQPFNQFLNGFVSTGRGPDRAFPDDRHPPAPAAKLSNVATVSLLIGGKFRRPKVGARGWHCCEMAARVSVPVATVNEDDHIMARHHKVRSARQVLAVKPVAETGSMQSSSHIIRPAERGG